MTVFIRVKVTHAICTSLFYFSCSCVSVKCVNGSVVMGSVLNKLEIIIHFLELAINIVFSCI